MGRVRICILAFFVLAACTVQTRAARSTATLSQPSQPTPYPFFTPRSADQAQAILTQAEQVIQYAWDHPLELPSEQYAYYDRVALDTAWNAVLYFPDDPRATAWKWKMAYYAVLDGEPQFAANFYVEQITEALNGSRVDIGGLPVGFDPGN